MIQKFPITALQIFDEFTHNIGKYGFNGLSVLSQGLKETFPDADLPEGIEGMYVLAELIEKNDE